MIVSAFIMYHLVFMGLYDSVCVHNVPLSIQSGPFVRWVTSLALLASNMELEGDDDVYLERLHP